MVSHWLLCTFPPVDLGDQLIERLSWCHYPKPGGHRECLGWKTLWWSVWVSFEPAQFAPILTPIRDWKQSEFWVNSSPPPCPACGGRQPPVVLQEHKTPEHHLPCWVGLWAQSHPPPLPKNHQGSQISRGSQSGSSQECGGTPQTTQD